MVRWSYVKGTSFVGVNLFRSEDGVRKDVMESLSCPHQGMLRTSMDSGIISNRVNSCVPKHLLLEGDRQLKISSKNQEMFSPTRHQCHVPKISPLGPQKQTALCAAVLVSCGFD